MAEETRILVVDDDADARCFVTAILADAGDYTVIEAEDGDECVQKAGEAMPALIILDVQMPRKDGFTAFKELRSNPATAEIPVVMLTGVGERTGISFSADDMDTFLGSRPDAYIEKPIDPAVLQRTVTKLLGA